MNKYFGIVWATFICEKLRGGGPTLTHKNFLWLVGGNEKFTGFIRLIFFCCLFLKPILPLEDSYNKPKQKKKFQFCEV